MIWTPLTNTKQAENTSAAPITARGMIDSTLATFGRNASAKKIAPIA